MHEFPYPYMEEHLSSHEFVEVEQGEKIGYFQVRHPKKSPYWFQVSYAPGVVTLSGDIGCLMFYRRNLNWLLESMDSLHYLMQSVPQQFKVKQRSRREASKWVEEMTNSEKNKPKNGLKANVNFLAILADARDMLVVSDSNLLSEGEYESLLELTREIWVDEPPSLDDFTMQTYWQLAALRCFERLYRARVLPK